MSYKAHSNLQCFLTRTFERHVWLQLFSSFFYVHDNQRDADRHKHLPAASNLRFNNPRLSLGIRSRLLVPRRREPNPASTVPMDVWAVL